MQMNDGETWNVSSGGNVIEANPYGLPGSHGEASCQLVHSVEPMLPACIRSRNAETIETGPTDNDFEPLVGTNAQFESS
jgi:hypothetical protein